MFALSRDAAKSSVVLDREPDQEKGLDPSALALDAHSVAGRPAKTTAGLVPAGIYGIKKA